MAVLVPSQRSGQMCCISFIPKDCIRVIGFPADYIAEIREVIGTSWEFGITKEHNFKNAHEFFLKEKPWSKKARFGQRAITRHELLSDMLMFMARIGYNLLQSADVSFVHRHMDTLFFEAGPGDRESQVFCLTFARTDRIRIIGASPSVVSLVRNAVLSHWPRGIQREKDKYGAPEMKLRGNPWSTVSNRASEVHARLMLMRVISNLKTTGFKLYASVNICKGRKKKGKGSDIDCWVFRKVGPAWH